MLTVDGEGGAHVFSAAADRDQAGIVHGEALNMADSSSELTDVLKINRSTHNIFYPKTRSLYRALASGPGGKEGLHIHCTIIDELHVWKGDELWSTLKYGYRSREEPLQFVITTAGSDMESRCRKEYERGKAILAGTIQDDSYFALIYEADIDDDWTDEAVWAKANPSLGETLTLESLREDCQSALDVPSEQSAFKRYTLNIWATAEHPWLDINRWKKCRADISVEELEGRLCYAALDMGQTSDLSCLALMFPEDDGESYTLLTYFWLPEDEAREKEKLVQYLVWADAGHIELIPGAIVDHKWIGQRVVDICNLFDVQTFRYDAMFAEGIAQRVEEESFAEKVEVPQTIMHFAGPCDAFERVIKVASIQHNGNPVMNWQIGHVNIKEDVNGNKRPVKQKEGDYRKIDGVIASVMALGGAIAADEPIKPGEVFVSI